MALRVGELVLFGLVVSLLRLLFCWFACHLGFASSFLGETLSCHKLTFRKGDSLCELEQHRRSPMKIRSAEVKKKTSVPMWNHPKREKSRMWKSQTAPYFNSTGNVLYRSCLK